MNNRTIIIFDFETTGKNPENCSPVQLAALAINPRKLEVIPNSEFKSYMKPHPSDFIDPETVDWHVKIRNNQLSWEDPLNPPVPYTSETLLNEWDTYTSQEIVWKNFVTYTQRYHMSGKSKSMYTAPIAGGANISKFDLVIVQRLAERYGNITKEEQKSNVFFPRDVLDIQTLLFYWWENLSDVPNSFSVDNLRDFFGMSKEKGHDALQDVKDCAEMIVRCLRIMRPVAEKVKFKGAIANDENRLIK